VQISLSYFPIKLLTKGTFMSQSQVERLKKDVEELNEYAKRLKRRGQKDLLSKIIHKKQFLEQHLAQAGVA
jgi:phage shock protein A